MSDSDIKTCSGIDGASQESEQPVVSLLEKYSSLHRGIEEARKEYNDKQVEIDDIKRRIKQLVEVDRIETEQAIETAVSEKEELLQQLESLATIDLPKAQDMDFMARSKLEASRARERAIRDSILDDRKRFLFACESFRERLHRASLRGAMLGLNIRTISLGAYEIFRACTKVEGREEKKDCSLLFLEEIQNSLQAKVGMDTDGEKRDIAGASNAEIENLQQKLEEQKKITQEQEAALNELKRKHSEQQSARDKREKQKSELQSQFERLQRDIRGVESQIENLREETRRAKQATARYQNGSFKDRNEPTKTNPATISQDSIEKSTKQRLVQLTPTENSGKIKKKSLAQVFNPYAQKKQKRHSPVTISPDGNSDNVSSGRPNQNLLKRKRNRQHTLSQDECGPCDEEPIPRENGNWQKSSDDPNRNTTPAYPEDDLRPSKCPHHRKHFGQTSLRPPCKALLKRASAISKSKNGEKNRELTPKNALALEDTDDESNDSDEYGDDDSSDDSWMRDGPTFSSLSRS